MHDSTAFLALWNDLAPGREAEYESWHTREHVPERVAAPGFRSGRRYRCATHPAHRWFTLYEVAGLGCFETPQYQDLLQNPTPLSAAMRPDFRNFLRVPCTVLRAEGVGLGAALAVLRLPDETALPDLAEMQKAEAIVRVRMGRHARSAEGSGAFRAGAEGSGASDAFTAVLLLEALDRPAAERAFQAAAAQYLPAHAAPQDAGGVYDLAFVFPGSDPTERLVHRRPSWAPE